MHFIRLVSVSFRSREQSLMHIWTSVTYKARNGFLPKRITLVQLLHICFCGEYHEAEGPMPYSEPVGFIYGVQRTRWP